ncbi:unnamed protein product [Ectocarpus sp. 6 AP-2014]
MRKVIDKIRNQDPSRLNHTLHNTASSALEPRTTIYRAGARARTKKKKQTCYTTVLLATPTNRTSLPFVNPNETKAITCVGEHRLSLLCAAYKARRDVYTTARTTRSLENTEEFENTPAVNKPTSYKNK